MSPDENYKLEQIHKDLQDIKQTQEDILDRMDKAEKVTDTTLEIANSVKGKVFSVIGWLVVLGLVGGLLWVSKKIGIMKILDLIK